MFIFTALRGTEKKKKIISADSACGRKKNISRYNLKLLLDKVEFLIIAECDTQPLREGIQGSRLNPGLSQEERPDRGKDSDSGELHLSII